MTSRPIRFENLTTREEFIEAAAEYGIELEPYEFTGKDPDDLHIDGMPAAQWLDAMTMQN
jgi:hypothetical protein